MFNRRRMSQTSSLEQRLAQEAVRLRKQAQGTPQGIEREQLIRRARQAETASHLSSDVALGGYGQQRPSSAQRTSSCRSHPEYGNADCMRWPLDIYDVEPAQ